MSDSMMTHCIQAALHDPKADEALITGLTLLWQRGEKRMQDLYGDGTQDVIEKCYQVSPLFCFQVLTNVYGIWWSNSLLNDYQKSLITQVALLASNQLPQWDVLVKTFFASGGSAGTLKTILKTLHQAKAISQSAYTHACELAADQGIALTDEEACLTDIAIATALGQPFKKNKNIALTSEQSIAAINHLLTYLGCPAVWNATSTYQQLNT